MSAEIYSIGHSNISYAAFHALLAQHNITAIADVRSTPYSKYCRAFSHEPLRAALEADGIPMFISAMPLAAGRQAGGCPANPLRIRPIHSGL